jgi:hypothetical protein
MGAIRLRLGSGRLEAGRAGASVVRRERGARRWSGGLAAVSRIMGLARSTIERVLKDLMGRRLHGAGARREGGGPRRKDERVRRRCLMISSVSSRQRSAFLRLIPLVPRRW